MMEPLFDNIAAKITLSQALKETIAESFVEQSIPKGHQLIEAGQIVRKLFFLEEGTIRSYHHGKDREITSWFYIDDQFFTCWYSFHGQEPSFEYLEAVSDCRMYTIDYQHYQDLLDTCPECQQLGRLIAEEQLAFIDYYSKGYMFLSATERYALLRSYIPDIELRVKLGQIASFLGVSQETLSRIRGKKQ